MLPDSVMSGAFGLIQCHRIQPTSKPKVRPAFELLDLEIRMRLSPPHFQLVDRASQAIAGIGHPFRRLRSMAWDESSEMR